MTWLSRLFCSGRQGLLPPGRTAPGAFLALLALLLLALPFPGQLCAARQPQVAVISLTGPINPVSAEYLRRNLGAAAKRGDTLFLVELDTPGGLDTAMRQAVQAILTSPVPVAAFVTPAGARAASAGAVIALSADVCAMSPGTNIGAAHPVSLGEKPDQVMADKILNDAEAYIEGIAQRQGRNVEVARNMVRSSISLSAESALKQEVIDLIASDRQDLLRKLDGRRVKRGGTESLLRLTGARVTQYPMSTRERILDIVGNPDVAYLLMMLGMLGIFFELAHPGVILPGVLGAISLLLAFFAFQTLPVNYAGVLLILLALILFIAELTVTSHGILGIGGVVSLLFGSILLFPASEPQLQLSWWVIASTVGFFSIFFAVVIRKGVEAFRQKPVTGVEGMLGAQGVAETDLGPDGKVFLHGEYWNATGIEPVRKGDRVEVVAVEGLRVKVRKAG